MSQVSPFLTNGTVVELLVSLSLGGFASFVAIISWRKSRTLSWIFVVAGILSLYAENLYAALRAFGLLSGPELRVFGASLANLVTDNLSLVFFSLACIVHARAGK